MSANSFNSTQIDPELLREFLLGSEEHLSAAETAIMELEKKPDDLGLINDIFRHFHSLKGDSASIGAESIRDLAHELESLLDRLRSRELSVVPELLDLLLEGLSAIGAQVTKVSQGEEIPSVLELASKIAAYTPEKSVHSVISGSENRVQNYAEGQSGLGEGAEGEASGEKTYIVFRTGKLTCTINVNQSNEIIPYSHITPVPNVESYIAGVINLRGSIVPVIHLSRRLNIAAAESLAPQILILIINGLKLGLLVDEVFGVKSWNDARLLRPESVAFELRRTFVSGVVSEEGRIILLLNILEIIKREK
jgi:chemotaxis protein histidine kinase CheA